MGTKKTVSERENFKFAILHHSCSTNIINTVNEDDYNKFSYNSSARFIGDLLYAYKTLVNNLEEFAKEDNKKVNFIDKIVCLAIALKNKRTFITGSKVRKNTKLYTINERFVSEMIISYFRNSTYKIYGARNKIIYTGDWDLDGFNNGHKKELNSFIKEMIELLSNDSFDYESFTSLLNKFYLRGVMYSCGIDLELEDTIKKHIVANELPDPVYYDTGDKAKYDEYKKSFRVK